MKYAIIGFSKVVGDEGLTLVAGPEVPRNEQAAIFLKAKQKGEFPKNLVRLEWVETKQIDIAICTKASAAHQAAQAALKKEPEKKSEPPKQTGNKLKA